MTASGSPTFLSLRRAMANRHHRRQRLQPRRPLGWRAAWTSARRGWRGAWRSRAAAAQVEDGQSLVQEMVAQVPASVLPFEDSDVCDRDSASPDLYGKRRVYFCRVAVNALFAGLGDLEFRHVAK